MRCEPFHFWVLALFIFSVQLAVASILSLFSWFLGEELSSPQYVPSGSMVPSCDRWWKPIWNIYWWTFIQAKLTFRSTLLLFGGPAYLSKRGEEHHCTLLQSKTSEFWAQNIKSMLVCLHGYIGLIDLFVFFAFRSASLLQKCGACLKSPNILWQD